MFYILLFFYFHKKTSTATNLPPMSPTEENTSSEHELAEGQSGNVTEAQDSEAQPGTSQEPPGYRRTRRRERQGNSASSRELGTMQKIGEDLVEFLKSIHENVSQDTDDDLHFLKSLLPGCQLVPVMDKFDMRCEMIQLVKRYAAKSGKTSVLSQMTPYPPYAVTEHSRITPEAESCPSVSTQATSSRENIIQTHTTDPQTTWTPANTSFGHGSTFQEGLLRYSVPSWAQGPVVGPHVPWHVPHQNPYGSMGRHTWQHPASAHLHPLPRPLSYGDSVPSYRPMSGHSSYHTSSELVAQAHSVLAESYPVQHGGYQHAQDDAPQNSPDDSTQVDI